MKNTTTIRDLFPLDAGRILFFDGAMTMQANTQAEAVLEQLKKGNARFAAGDTIQHPELSLHKLRAFANQAQNPKAVILCCSDSRAPVEMIFDQDIGDLFVIRVAGNIVAPSLVGSVEFAVSTFGTQLVVVMGHTQCGAIKATMDNILTPQAISSENLHDIISRIKPHIFTISQLPVDPEEQLRQATEANVRASVSQLAHSSRLIEDLQQQGALIITGAVLDLATGVVGFL